MKSQYDKSYSTLSVQPKSVTSKIQLIMAMDIAGYNGEQISSELGMTPARISVIRNTPFYKRMRDERWESLQSSIIEKKSHDIATGDYVSNKLKSLATNAVNKYEDLLVNASSDFVKKSTADAILDRAGYKAHTDKSTMSIELTSKMADRFARVLSNDCGSSTSDNDTKGASTNGNGKDARISTIRVTKTVSQ